MELKWPSRHLPMIWVLPAYFCLVSVLFFALFSSVPVHVWSPLSFVFSAMSCLLFSLSFALQYLDWSSVVRFFWFSLFCRAVFEVRQLSEVGGGKQSKVFYMRSAILPILCFASPLDAIPNVDP